VLRKQTEDEEQLAAEEVGEVGKANQGEVLPPTDQEMAMGIASNAEQLAKMVNSCAEASSSEVSTKPSSATSRASSPTTPIRKHLELQ